MNRLINHQAYFATNVQKKRDRSSKMNGLAFINEKLVAAVDGGAFAAADLEDLAGASGRDLVLHLHGLKDDEVGVGRHFVADLADDAKSFKVETAAGVTLDQVRAALKNAGIDAAVTPASASLSKLYREIVA